MKYGLKIIFYERWWAWEQLLLGHILQSWLLMWDGVKGGLRWLRLVGAWLVYTWQVSRSWKRSKGPTDYGWFELVFTLPPHFIFSHLCVRVWLRGWERLVECACKMQTYMCMCAFTSWFKSMTVAVFTRTRPHSSMAFYRLPACLALLSLVLTWAPVHTSVSMCDSELKFLCMKTMLVYQPPSCPVFYFTAPKQVPLVCLLKIVPMVKNTHKCHLSLLALFLPFSFFVTALFLTVWDTNLCEFRKTQRYSLPLPDYLFL